MATVPKHPIPTFTGYPRCDICRSVIRIRNVDHLGAICAKCLSETLPFIGMVSEGDFKLALKEFREGLCTRMKDFESVKFNPFGEEEREIMKGLNNALQGCKYQGGEKMGAQLKAFASKSGCSLSMLFHNIRSAKGPGLELFEAEIRRWGIPWDIIGLAETWLDAESEKFLNIRGFSAVCASREKKSGGGVALLIKEGLIYRERKDLGVFKEGIIESAFVEMVRGEGRGNEVVGVIYRPPGGNVAEFNEELGQILSKTRGKNTYLLGDFNLDLLQADKHKPTNDFLQGLYVGGFYPLISLPTRITDTSATLIDNIWTNNLLAEMSSGLITVRISDHLPAYAFVGGNIQGSEGIKQGNQGWHRTINDSKIARFAEDLSNWNFDEARAMGVEANVARFRNEFRDLYDRAFPWSRNKKNRKDEQKPWLDNQELKTLIAEKSKLYSLKVKGRLDDNGRERLAEVTKQVNSMRQKLKRTYFQQKLERIKGNLKATWEVLGEALRGKKSKLGGAPCSYFEENGVGVTDGNKIVKGFCDFYCKIGPDLAKKVPAEHERNFKDYLGDRVEESLYWRPTSPIEVEEFCQALDGNKGMGWDGISPRVIKAVAREISGPLSRLFNCCMREGYYPASFKVARVVPVFKAEDQTQFSNYRPVSVLPVLSQVFERILKARLVQFLGKHDIIIPSQYGFRAGHSTAMAVLDMVEKIRQAWADKHDALGVFIDLKKAFDTVDHDILLSKLEHYGVRGQTLNLLKSYLGGRSQYVCYGGYESERGPVVCGVPQGSVLGPLFFLIYVNDMIRASQELEFVLFADDTNIFASSKEVGDLFKKVNAGMEELSKWFRCNKLTLNLKKTEYVYFGKPGTRSKPSLGLKVGGQEIRRVEGARFLGVWVDEKLRWSEHIDRVSAKVGRLVGVLGRIRTTIGGSSLHKLYNALVLPHLQYCLMVWGDFQEGKNKTQGEKLLKYQKTIMSMIEGSGRRNHSEPIFYELGILKIDDLYRQQLRIHAWKFSRGMLPENQRAMLCMVRDTHNYETRASGNRLLSYSTQDQRCIGYRLPREWQSTPSDVREASGLQLMKKRSKQHFLLKYSFFECSTQNCFICSRSAE